MFNSREILRRARAREIVTPDEYGRIFNEGAEAYWAEGLDAANPYLNLDPRTAAASIRGPAWEQGWWSACRDEALAPE